MLRRITHRLIKTIRKNRTGDQQQVNATTTVRVTLPRRYGYDEVRYAETPANEVAETEVNYGVLVRAVGNNFLRVRVDNREPRCGVPVVVAVVRFPGFHDRHRPSAPTPSRTAQHRQHADRDGPGQRAGCQKGDRLGRQGPALGCGRQERARESQKGRERSGIREPTKGKDRGPVQRVLPKGGQRVLGFRNSGTKERRRRQQEGRQEQGSREPAWDDGGTGQGLGRSVDRKGPGVFRLSGSGIRAGLQSKNSVTIYQCNVALQDETYQT